MVPSPETEKHGLAAAVLLEGWTATLQLQKQPRHRDLENADAWCLEEWPRQLASELAEGDTPL